MIFLQNTQAWLRAIGYPRVLILKALPATNSGTCGVRGRARQR